MLSLSNNGIKSIESDHYTPITEDIYEIIMKCKSLLTDSKIDSIRVIIKEIVDINSIKRQIFLNGIIDMQNLLNYKTFLKIFEDYVTDLDCFFTLPEIFQHYDKILDNNNEGNIFDKVFYVNSSKKQSLININGNIINLEDLLKEEPIKGKLKLLIFWKTTNDIEFDMDIYLDIAKTYNNSIYIIFISNSDDFIQKKIYLHEKKFVHESNTKINDICDNIQYIFDDKFLFNKFFIIKFPWFTILDKNNNIYDSGILRIDEIKSRVSNFLGTNPESGKNINNLFWIDISDKIKKNIVKEINLMLSELNYNNIFFYIETNISIALDNYNSFFDIDAYFIGDLKGSNNQEFKDKATKICDSKKIKNINYIFD